MKAIRRNGTTALTLEKPEIKTLRKAQEVLEGIRDLSMGTRQAAANDAALIIGRLLGELAVEEVAPVEQPQ